VRFEIVGGRRSDEVFSRVRLTPFRSLRRGIRAGAGNFRSGIPCVMSPSPRGVPLPPVFQALVAGMRGHGPIILKLDRDEAANSAPRSRPRHDRGGNVEERVLEAWRRYAQGQVIRIPLEFQLFLEPRSSRVVHSHRVPGEDPVAIGWLMPSSRMRIGGQGRTTAVHGVGHGRGAEQERSARSREAFVQIVKIRARYVAAVT